MSNAKHTPGPWTPEPGRTMWTIIGAGFTGPMEANKSYPRVADGEREANARLIAAAPDLLAAAKEAVEGLFNLAPKYPEQGCFGDPLADGPCPCTACKLNAAIAKAEGRS